MATHVNGSTLARSPTTPVDTQFSSGTHSDGSASARPSGYSDSQSCPHKITSVHFVGLTLGLTVRQLRQRLSGYFIHSTNEKSDCVSVLRPSHSYYLKTFYAAVSHKLSRVTLTLSHFSTQSHNSTQLIHSLRSSRAPDSLVTCRSHARPAVGRSTQSAKTKETNCQTRRSMSQKMAGQRSLYAKTVDRKFARD